MSEKIYVDQDKLNTQMGQLNDALDNIPDYDCTLESSPMGSLQSEIKCAELSVKMQQLIKAYKQLMKNSVIKAHAAAAGYKDVDEIMANKFVGYYTVNNGLDSTRGN